jgi:tripartite-type tricarboxylate transporter receptor subunit TctC
MRKRIVLGLALLLALPAVALAEWPSDKPVEIIVGFGPGGGTDIMARAMAPFLEKRLNGKFIVVNKPGASGEIAYTAIALAKPDGYTLGFVNTPGYLTVHYGRKAQFKIEDIHLIGRMVDDPTGHVVRAGGEITSVKYLVAMAKAKPKSITIGTFGHGTDDHLAVLKLERLAGVQFVNVPYAGMGQLMAALLGGHLHVGGLNVGEFAGLSYDAEKLRMIGQMSESRWEELKDVPTFKEQGFDVQMSSERGLGGPKGIPPAILAKLTAAIVDMLKDPEFKKVAEQQKLPMAWLPGEKWGAKIANDMKQLDEIWKTSPWR